MTMSLYNCTESGVQNVFTWAPDVVQWWVTGFNIDYKDPVSTDITMISPVDFSNNEAMYE